MTPDTLGPLGLPLAGALWAALLIPHLARWNRARRAERKNARMPTPETLAARRAALIREEYAEAPALSPFSRSPLSYETAAELGTRSASRAAHRADSLLAEEAA